MTVQADKIANVRSRLQALRGGATAKKRRPERFIIQGETISREVPTSDELVSNIEDRDLASFLTTLGEGGSFETGFLPSNVRLLRQGGGYQRIVMVLPPEVNPVIWGASERDPNQKRYMLAQPYRVIIGDYHNGNFLGGRQFYSPEPVLDLDAPLYHANVPNLNCKGYRGTSVGWVCLYHRDTQVNMDVAERAAYLGMRMSGAEAYNDNNMSGTDGPRFYAQMKKPDFTSDPQRWEKKSDAEGVSWTLDPNLWIPVLVTSENSQTEHVAGGVPLTLRMALDGRAPMYYNDSGERSWTGGANINAKALKTAYTKATVTEAFREVTFELPEGIGPIGAPDSPPEVVSVPEGLSPAQALTGAAAANSEAANELAEAAPDETYHCPSCDGDYSASLVPKYDAANGTFSCMPCYDGDWVRCGSCGRAQHCDNMVWDGVETESWYCAEHPHRYTCAKCGVEHIEAANRIDDIGCTSCIEVFTCDYHGGMNAVNDTQPVGKEVNGQTMAVCAACSTKVECQHCHRLYATNYGRQLGDAFYCVRCMSLCATCGRKSFIASGQTRCVECEAATSTAEGEKVEDILEISAEISASIE